MKVPTNQSNGDAISRVKVYPRAFRIALLFLTAACFGFHLGFAQDYLITNDDSTTNGVSFFTIGVGGSLEFAMEVEGPGIGIDGGLFGMSRIAAVNTANTHCIFATESFTNDVFWIVPGSQYASGSAAGSPSDNGSANGVGIAANAQYVYASFSSSNTVATFQVQTGCALSFVSDIVVAGLNGGVIDGMGIHANTMIATYADGSIESFNVAAGTPVSNGDKQYSTASVGGESYPNGIDITQDGRFAIFGDTSTADIVEVSDISSGKLTPTIVYRTNSGISSSNLLLSPDETILYVSNTQGDAVTAAFFDKNTGEITPGCKSNRIRNYVSDWSYLGSMTLQQISGNGGGVFVAEFGVPSGIAALNLIVNGSQCALREAKDSPTTDYYSRGLLSIGRFPPRAF